MNNGWIKLHRSLLDWEWYSDMNVRVVFIHCLLKANCKDVKYKGKDILRGSFATGLELLSRETGLTIAQIRVTLNKLKMTNEITIQTSAEGSIISITNYDLYQSNDKQNDKPIASEMTNESQTNDKPIASNNNNKNDKNKENKEKDTIVSKKKEIKNSFGLKGLVKLTPEEYEKLCGQYSKAATDDKILSLEAHRDCKKYLDHYLTLNNWLRTDNKVFYKPKQTGLFGNNCAEQKSELIEAIERRKREDEEKAKTQIDEEDSLPF